MNARSFGLSDEAPLPADQARRKRIAIPALILCGVGAWLIPNLIGKSSSNASSFGTGHRAAPFVIVAELLVRYPLSVLAEEGLFRGWLQPRVGTAGPVIAGVLWALGHIQQPSTIPSLIPLGIALGVIRWWTGNIRAGAILHYIANGTFFLGNYT